MLKKAAVEYTAVYLFFNFVLYDGLLKFLVKKRIIETEEVTDLNENAMRDDKLHKHWVAIIQEAEAQFLLIVN